MNESLLLPTNMLTKFLKEAFHVDDNEIFIFTENGWLVIVFEEV